MNKKLQVFVSSTYTDLIEERQAAVQAILDAGHIPAGMELFKAGNESQLKTIYKWIDESDVYMLILGGRYGSVESMSGKSYTQLEYEYAISKNIPVFAVVLSESFLTNKVNTLGLTNAMEQKAPDKYQAFKAFVMSKIIREVDDCKDIKIEVHAALNEFINDPNITGWTRNIAIKNKINSNIIIGPKNYIGSNNFIAPKRQQISIFVVMPFSETWSEETYDIIKEVCNNLDVNLNRADEILGSQSIYNDIITNIIKSDIIIVDITVKNANVFYELGYAHALKKNVILIRQPHDNVPFDIAQFRYIEYELSFKKAKEFQKRLTDTISIYKK